LGVGSLAALLWYFWRKPKVIYSSGFEDSPLIPSPSWIYLTTKEGVDWAWSHPGQDYIYPPTQVAGKEIVWYNEQGTLFEVVPDAPTGPQGFTQGVPFKVDVDTELLNYVTGHKTGLAYHQEERVHSGTKAVRLTLDKNLIGLDNYGRYWSYNNLVKYLVSPDKVQHRRYSMSGWYYLPSSQVDWDDLLNCIAWVGNHIERHAPDGGTAFDFGVLAWTGEVYIHANRQGVRQWFNLGKIPYSVFDRWIKITLEYDLVGKKPVNGYIESAGQRKLSYWLAWYDFYELYQQPAPVLTMWTYFQGLGFNGEFLLDDLELRYS